MNGQRTVRAGYVYRLPQMIASPESISLKICAGETADAGFTIRAEDGSLIFGKVLSDSGRITFEKDEFEGRNCEIRFTIGTTGLSAGEKIHADILVRSNLSEYTVPADIEITDVQENGRFGDVRTLDDFSRVCQRSMREGFRLFTDPDFPGVLNGNNRQYLALYRGMSANPVTYQNLEEFLVATGKKEPVEISTDKQEKAVYHLDASQKDTLFVYRSTWGYIRLEVETEGSFLEVDRKIVTGDDFIGGVYGLEYVVHKENLGEGRSFGKIRIRSAHQVLEYQIEASAQPASEIRPQIVRARRIAWLLRDYLNLQLHILDQPSWLESSMLTVGEMLEADPSDPWAMLYKAYIEYTRGDNAKAIEALWPFRDGSVRTRSDELRAMYLYLAKRVELLPREKADILPTLRKYSARNPQNYLLLRLYHDEEDLSQISSADLMQAYENCYLAGCSSPFLYLDAWTLLASEETLLRRLSDFMIHVLSFGAENGLMTHELIQRTAFLCGNMKNYHPLLFRLLTKSYEKYSDDEVLEAICKMAIKGNPIAPSNFRWYARAVERDIRVTRLYEYYMETYHQPAEEELPLPIKMYFATNNTLGENRRALLYASIILHRKQDETSYQNYIDSIRAFAERALEKRRIDVNYAILYREFFMPPRYEKTAALLSAVLFMRKITVADPAIRRVVVSGTAMKRESSAPVRDGVAYVPMYTDDECILFEDVSQRRYAVTVPYEQKRLFDERESAKAILEAGIDDPGAELCVCREKAFQMDINADTVAACRAASRNDAFTDDYRRILRKKLIAWDGEQDRAALTADVIRPSELELCAEADKAGTVKVLTCQERYEDAWRVIRKYGTEDIPLPVLKEITDHMAGSDRRAGSDTLVYAAWQVFRNGLADRDILRFLLEKYDGSLQDLCRLWKRARAEGLRTTALGERILLRSVETHQFPDDETAVLKSVLRTGGRREVVYAFLAYLSDYYFLGDRPMTGETMIILESAVQKGELTYTICKLALLKYYAGLGSLTDSRRALCRRLLAEMDAKGCRFDFFRDLPKDLTQAYQIEDKIFIEQQADPSDHLTIHYRLSEADDASGEWVSEPMRNVYHGIFSKEFLLFYGEKLTYYLSITDDSGTTNTDSFEISLVDMDTTGSTKYRLLNRMLEARDLSDMDALEDAMNIYLRQEAQTAGLLHTI